CSLQRKLKNKLGYTPLVAISIAWRSILSTCAKANQTDCACSRVRPFKRDKSEMTDLKGRTLYRWQGKYFAGENKVRITRANRRPIRLNKFDPIVRHFTICWFATQ